MQVTFYGAAREVTGSMHLLDTGESRILLDCGMFQGRRKESRRKNQVVPFDPSMIDNIILSHAHMDHSGRIPLLVKDGCRGRVICTRATADACDYLLRDSAHIQESDADYLNYKTLRSAMYRIGGELTGRRLTDREQKSIKQMLKKGPHALRVETIEAMMEKFHIEGVRPLYTTGDAEQALKSFDGYPYGHPVTVGRDTTCTFYDAGHILGSAISMITTERSGRRITICYTGDVGRFGKPIIRNPTLQFDRAHREVDLMIMESTYGNRVHDPVIDLKPRFREVLVDNAERGGSVIIPSFAFGRTQELLYVLHELYDEGSVPRIPVYIDSPLATRLTRVFGEHPEVYDRRTHEDFLVKGENPFAFKEIEFVESVEASMAVNRETRPHIVISASGMCEAGRVLHHLRHKIHNPKNTILIVGFMAQNTLGRRIQELGAAYEAAGRQGEAPVVKFFNKTYPLRARVVNLGGFSAHANRTELLRLLEKSNLTVKRIAVVHGEEEQSLAFADALAKEGFAVTVPRAGETIRVG